MIAVIYALAMAVLLVYGLNLLWLSLGPARPTGAPDDAPSAPAEGWPSVTVQLPVYNEAHVIERLIDACARLDYPQAQLEIQVLDDSTDETRELAEQRAAYWRQRGVNISCMRRPTRRGYKAGALAYGLERAAGDFVAIFDADFVPPPDFLKRMLPRFDAPDIGLVQARWGHLNRTESWLTQVQALALDAHFCIEQTGRNRAGCFMNFNGTAGVWRRACIDDAGGWQADTLTEDLDLSYRAQLNGWRLRMAMDVAVPAELPANVNGLRTQQHRWTKGGVEVARKLLRRLWRSAETLGVKLQGSIHLLAPFVFPCILVTAVLHAPLLLASEVGLASSEASAGAAEVIAGPGPWYFSLMGLGILGFVGFFLAQVQAQRNLQTDWVRRLRLFPIFAAGMIGLSVNNGWAVLQGLLGQKSAFVRTPKFSTEIFSAGTSGAWWKSRYANTRVDQVAWWEAALCLYCAGGLVLLVANGIWSAVPFQTLFTVSFAFFASYSFRQARLPAASGARATVKS